MHRLVSELCAIHSFGAVGEFSVFAASSAHLAAAISLGSATLYWNSVLPQACGLHRVQTPRYVPVLKLLQVLYAALPYRTVL